MNDDEKVMTQEEAEADFKNKMAKIFMDKIPDAHVDEDGFICIPMVSRTKKDEEQ